ncbi:uncharacterized protein LOC124413301 [Diprion similis]|uniref:uncharacterized protein LOC124413301 n=1 Tax=Diprion similis TaxID=362088 RepID=UPI001EF8E460|nr:uncharacterized protein LOC124413301 [Diprion similis]
MASVVQFVAFVFLVIATAAESCRVDADCSQHQYCYETSKKCVNYTKCASYDRRNGSTQARDAKQCGPCLPGFSAEVNTDGQEATTCKKNDGNQYPFNMTALIWGLIGCLISVIIIIYLTHLWIKVKCCEKCYSGDLECAVSVLEPTAPPASANNNNYGDMYNEQRIPLQAKKSTAYPGAMMVDKPVKAQACHPPDWVNADPNYDSQESPATLTTNLEIQEEETIQSVWTPGQTTSTIVADRPFASISAEQAENTMNMTLDLVTRCPTPSSSGQERRENNGPSATPPRPEHSNANPNPPSATFISANVNLNVINSGCCSSNHK